MIDGKRVIAVVPARGGSKSVPYKNIKLVAGKPLLAWPIDIAKQVPEIDRIIVSTDDDKIASVAKQYGAEVMLRPSELATDSSLVIDTIRHVISVLKTEGESAVYMVLLEATCPLRTVKDVSDSIKLLAQSPEKFNSVGTFTEATLNPYRAWKINHNTPTTFIDGAVPWLPRQKLPKAYQLNGAVYAFEINSIQADSPSILCGKIGAVQMPKERSVDIDDEVDFMIVESLINRGMV